jgi:hypothetical protein
MPQQSCPGRRVEANAARRICSLAILAALLFGAMVICSWPLKPGIPSLQLTFSEAAFRSVLSQWNADELLRFKIHFIIDFPFLACYGALGHLLVKQSTALSAPRFRGLLAFALPVAAAADALENLLQLYFLFATGPVSQAAYFAAGVAALIKWLLIAIFVAQAAYAGMASCFRAHQ